MLDPELLHLFTYQPPNPNTSSPDVKARRMYQSHHQHSPSSVLVLSQRFLGLTLVIAVMTEMVTIVPHRRSLSWSFPPRMLPLSRRRHS